MDKNTFILAMLTMSIIYTNKNNVTNLLRKLFKGLGSINPF